MNKSMNFNLIEMWLNILLYYYPMIINFIVMLLISLPMKYYNFHPMKLLTILLCTIMIIALKMNSFMKSWMPMIFMLIMIGGLMIMFMYVVSLNNNNMFKINFKNFVMYLLKIILIIIIIYFFYPFNYSYLNNLNYWNSMNILNNMDTYMKISESFYLNKLTLIYLMLYLLITMIIIMNICFKMKNPLRQMQIYE